MSGLPTLDDPQTWPEWPCDVCQQWNVGWAGTCGSCDQKRINPNGPAIRRTQTWVERGKSWDEGLWWVDKVTARTVFANSVGRRETRRWTVTEWAEQMEPQLLDTPSTGRPLSPPLCPHCGKEI